MWTGRDKMERDSEGGPEVKGSITQDVKWDHAHTASSHALLENKSGGSAPPPRCMHAYAVAYSVSDHQRLYIKSIPVVYYRWMLAMLKGMVMSVSTNLSLGSLKTEGKRDERV